MSARALLSDGIDGFAPELLVAPTAKGSIQTLLVGDPPVSAAKHLEELLEDYPAGYAGAGQPGGLFASFSGSRGGDCSQTGSMQYERISATAWRSFSSGRFSTSPDDRASRARHANGRAVLYWRKLLIKTLSSSSAGPWGPFMFLRTRLGRGVRSYTPVCQKRSGRPDLGVYRSRFEPLSLVLSPLGRQEPVRRLQRRLRWL